MKGGSHILAYLVIPIVLFGMGCATLLEQADQLFESKGFAVAEEKLERALSKDSANIDLALNLVDTYLKNNKFEAAEDLYAQIIENPKADAVQKLRYAEQLMDAGKYEQVKTILDILNFEMPGNPQVNELVKSMDAVEEFLNSMVELENYFKNDGAFEVVNVDFNSPESEFSPTFYKDMLVFASARDKISYVTYLHAWDNQPFTSIYYSNKDGDRYTDPKLFEPHLQNRFHDGVVSFSKDGQQMFYTQNDISELKERRRKGLPLNLKISRSDYVNSEWTDPVSFKYNHPDYNCAHPTLSKDGQRLYFSSDMPANLFGPGNPTTYGEMDLYVCEKVNQEWGIPQNLGPEVNSEGDEVFPYVNADGSLFFASNGHVGFGGLDLFHVSINNNTGHSRKNLGSPVNSKQDDFGVIVYEDGTSGFFCSDRPGGKGHDDIYAFKGYKLPMQLEVLVVDASTGKPIEKASVELTQNENPSTSMTTDSMGMAEKTIYRFSDFNIQANKNGYKEGSTILNTEDYTIDSIPLIKITLDKVLEITDHCDIFKEIDKYRLGDISMNKIPRLQIAKLINDCALEIDGRIYTRNDIKIKNIIPGSVVIQGQVMDCDGIQKISGVEILAQELNNNTKDFIEHSTLKSVTCDDGTFSMHLLPEVEYLIKTLKIGKPNIVDTLFIKHTVPTPSINYYLCDKNDPDEEEEDTTLVIIKNIHFDLAKADIRKDAESKLDEIVRLMKDHPDWIIELGSHTDSRGGDIYNQNLSDKRAISSVDYIVSKGISRSRITGKGYGETQLKNRCKNGVPCSEAEHQQNRRTEFKIVGMAGDSLIN